MPNIVLSRIDERLIHGQVGVQWVGFAGANLVLVANDEVAEDTVQQNLMEMVLAEGIAVRFWSLQKRSITFTAPPTGRKFYWYAEHRLIFSSWSKAVCPSHASMWETCITPKVKTNCQNGFCRRERYQRL